MTARLSIKRLHPLFVAEVTGIDLTVTIHGIVMIDSPHKPSDALKLKAEIETRGPLRYIINTEPHADTVGGKWCASVSLIAEMTLDVLHLKKALIHPLTKLFRKEYDYV